MPAEFPREPSSALSEALHELGRTSTPHELEQRGVRRLRSVSTADIARLVEQAVNRTLLERTLGVDPAEMEAMFATAQRSLLGLVRSARQIERSRGALDEQRAELAAELGSMHDERARADERAAEADDAESWKEAARLRGAVRAALARSLGQTPRPETEDALVEAVLAHLATRRAATRARDTLARDEQVERLERRVRKLMRSLEETEAVLRQVAAKKDLEVGIESLYRAVQGLAPQDADGALKRQMMALIFAANLELHSELGLTSAATPDEPRSPAS